MRDGPKEKSPKGFFSMRRKASVQERKPFVFQPSMLGTRIIPLTDEPRVSLHDRMMSPSRLQDRIDRCQEWSEAQGLSGDSERVEWTSSLRSQRSPSPIRSPYAMPDVSDLYGIVTGTDPTTRPSRQRPCSRSNLNLPSNDRESATHGRLRACREDLRSARSVLSGLTYQQGLIWIVLVSRLIILVD